MPVKGAGEKDDIFMETVQKIEMIWSDPTAQNYMIVIYRAGALGGLYLGYAIVRAEKNILHFNNIGRCPML